MSTPARQLPLTEQDRATWRALAVFSGYRLFLSGMLFLVFYLGLPPDFLGQADPAFYATVSQLYLLMAVIMLFATVAHWGGADTQIKLQLILDIVMLTLIMHASGGLQTGLGVLLLVVVVAGGALIPGRLAAFVAAIATLAVLLEVSYSQIAGDDVTKYSQAGMLGVAFFVTAWLARWLSQKMQRSELLAEERARDVANLAVLNQHIISRMQIGVLVLDEQCRIRLLNQSARALLGLDATATGASLKSVVPELYAQIRQWRQGSLQPFEPLQARADLPEVRASATRLDSGEVLLYIEDVTALAQQAQQLKLASLGRLTASIAHEIRNPLGAISHAGELLAESRPADPAALKLTDIIQRHSRRVNGIIENILQMSRRNKSEAEAIVLALWLEQCLGEYRDFHRAGEDEITLRVDAPLAQVLIDPEQLHQIMWNLLENAWHFCDRSGPMPAISVTLGRNGDEIYIEVLDNGPGVAAEVREQLFEPFYSGREGGTGLGLYLAAELCRANGARLGYVDAPAGGGRFRISFAGQWQGMKEA